MGRCLFYRTGGNHEKVFTSLPFRLLVALAVGILLGQVFGESAMKVVVSLQFILGQLIMFCVPLIVIGFIAPSITRMGNNASRMLGVARRDCLMSAPSARRS